MGLLLKIVVFGVAAYTLWMTVTRCYRLFSGRRPNEPIRSERPPAQPAARAQVEDTYACKICGAYVLASARKCERPDCPQPA